MTGPVRRMSSSIRHLIYNCYRDKRIGVPGAHHPNVGAANGDGEEPQGAYLEPSVGNSSRHGLFVLLSVYTSHIPELLKARMNDPRPRVMKPPQPSKPTPHPLITYPAIARISSGISGMERRRAAVGPATSTVIEQVPFDCQYLQNHR